MPFNQKMLLHLEAKAGDYQLQLVNNLGSVIYSAQRFLETGDNQWVVPTADLPPGSYIIYVQGPKEQGSLKVVKQ